MKKLLTTLSAAIIAIASFAQQDFMVSQYMFNELILNPAYAGTHEVPTVSALFRKQWMGFTGAPTTTFLTYQAKAPSINSGYGVILSNDNIGVSHQTDLLGVYSYQLKTGKNSTVSFGMQAGVSFYKANLTELDFWDEADAEFQNNLGMSVHPNFGFGLYHYVDNDYFVGISTPRVVEYNTNNFLSVTQKEVLKQQRHYYLHGGKVLELNDNKTVLKPSVLLKYFPGVAYQVDINMNVYYNKLIGAGISYRTQESIVLLADAIVYDNLRLGIAYDIPIGKLSSYHSGSFEVMLSYDIQKTSSSAKFPRYF